MTMTLYDATIPVYLQLLGGARNLVDKAVAYCDEQGVEPKELLDARLIDDMEPYSFQVKAMVMHSLGAIEGVRKGSFSPDPSAYPENFGEAREKIGAAIASFEKIEQDEINGFVGQPMQFKLRETTIPFTAEGFLMSFSIPNFQFHTTTAYDILRSQGVKIGKIDYLGQLQAAAG